MKYTYGEYTTLLLKNLSQLHHLPDTNFISALFSSLTKNSSFFSYRLGEIPPTRPSRLCWDGTPIEFSVSLARLEGGLRYVVDTLNPLMPVEEKIHNALETLGQALELSSIRVDGFRAFFSVFFSNPLPLSGCLDFIAWYGLQHRPNDISLKLYVNLRWLSSEAAWRFISMFLDEEKKNALDQIFRSKVLPYRHRIVFAGFEITSDALHAMKIYFRFYEVTYDFMRNLIEKLGLQGELFFSLLDELLFKDKARIDSLILSIKITSAGDIHAKIEVPAISYFRSDAAALKTLSEVASRLNLDDRIYRRTLEIISQHQLPLSSVVYHTMWGLVTDNNGNLAMNIYLKPNFWFK